MRIAPSILFLLLIFGWASGQPSEFQFHPLNDKDGLGKELVNKMIPDRNGGLWLATNNGLVFFDGNHASYFKHSSDSTSIINNSVQSVTQDLSGNIWGGTENGVFCFDMAKRKFRNYTMPKVMERGVWDVICDKDGTVWINGWHGLARLKKNATAFDTVAFYRASPNGPELLYMIRNSLLDDPSGEGIWLATRSGLRYFHKGSGRIDDVWSMPGHPLFTHNRVAALSRTNDNRFWCFDIITKTLICFDPKSRSVLQRISVATVAPNAVPYTLFESNDGKLWLGLSQNEILVIDSRTGEILARPKASLADPYAIAGNTIVSAMQDADGTIWLGTSAGISKWYGKDARFRIHKLGADHTMFKGNSDILHLTEDTTNGTWWIGTSDFKAIQYDPVTAKGKVYDLLKLRPPGWQPEKGTITYLRILNGQAVVCTYSGCYTLLPSGKVVPFQPLPKEYDWFKPFDIVTKDNVNFYFGNGRQVIHYNKSTNTSVLLPNIQPPSPKFQSSTDYLTVAPNGSVWMTASWGWLVNYQNNGLDSTNLISNRDMESHGYFTSLDIDPSGKVWITSNGVGLYRYDPTTRKTKLFTSEDGLGIEHLAVAISDRYNNIWCGGLHQYSVRIAQTGVFYNFSLPLYQQNASWYLKMVLLKNGNIAAGAFQDVIEFFPDRLMQKPVLKKPLISGAEVNGRFRLLVHDSILHLSADENSIAVRFGLMTDQEIYPYVFTWQLENLDDTWQTPGDRSEAVFNQLPPGRYVLKVKAVARNKTWESPVSSLVVIIDKRFYQTWWFRFLAALLFAGLLYTFYRYRLDKQKQILLLETKTESLEKEKAMIQYESLKQHLNPHFLFNSLTSLRSLIKTDSKTAAWFLDGLSKVYRYVLKSADQELVLLKDEVAFVQTFAELQKIRFGEGLQVLIKISPEAGQRHIAPVVLQNLVENAIKHNTTSIESPLVIEIFTDDNRLYVRNNLQRYRVVETSNKQGLLSLKNLYSFYTDVPIDIEESAQHFTISIPLL